ncbi:hypothetical protein YC2023_013832 [Brassica napus]
MVFKVLPSSLEPKVQDVALLQLRCKMGFEKWVLQAESAGTILKSRLDSQASLNSEEFGVVHVIKAKSCRLGPSQKTVGDYSLLLVHLLMPMLTTLLLYNLLV